VEKGSIADLTIRGASGLYKFMKKTQARRNLPETFVSIVSAIEAFKPARRYKNEFPYQTDLRGWLHAKFGSAEIEVQKGRSRPDIVIGEVAIEVKGPTANRDLITIADKINRYSQHFERMIVVLFAVSVSKNLYDEWLRGITKQYPGVAIVRK